MHRLTAAMIAIATIALPATVSRAEQIAVATGAGRLYVVDVRTLAARRIAYSLIMFDIAAGPGGKIYGITGAGALWEIDAGNHEQRQIGQAGAFVNALMLTRRTGLLGAGGNGLYRISRKTGRATLIVRLPGFNSSGDISEGPDGALYATGRAGAADILFRIDLAARSARPVGAGIGFRHVYGLVWSASRRRFLGVTEARELIEIDPASGKGRLLGVLNIHGAGYGAAPVPEAIAPVSVLRHQRRGG